MLEFDAIASVEPERGLRRPLVYGRRVGGIELAHLEAMLEIGLALGEANEKILESDFAVRPITPQLIGNGGM